MTNFLSMKEIGKEIGWTSHQVGRLLKKLGLRTPEGKPSREAFAAGMCAQRWTPDGEHYLWAWDGERALRLLAAGSLEAESAAPPGRRDHPARERTTARRSS